MKRDFGITVDITAPAQRVWAVMSDIEHWHEWTESIESVERLDTGSFAVGSRAVIRQPKLQPAKFTVTALEEGRRFTWESRNPGVSVVADHRIEEIDGKSRVTLSLRFSGLIGPIASYFMRDLINRYLGMEAAGLKKRCEVAKPRIWLAARPRTLQAKIDAGGLILKILPFMVRVGVATDRASQSVSNDRPR